MISHIHQLYINVLIISVFSLLFAPVTAGNMRPDKDGLFPTLAEHKEWCFTMKSKYEILPGQSFGKLPKMMHDLYLKAKCDQFFCEPNHGRGKFKCIPLADA